MTGKYVEIHAFCTSAHGRGTIYSSTVQVIFSENSSVCIYTCTENFGNFAENWPKFQSGREPTRRITDSWRRWFPWIFCEFSDIILGSRWPIYNLVVHSMNAGVHHLARALLSRSKMHDWVIYFAIIVSSWHFWQVGFWVSLIFYEFWENRWRFLRKLLEISEKFQTVEPWNLAWLACLESISEAEILVNKNQNNSALRRLQTALTQMRVRNFVKFPVWLMTSS